MSFISSYSNMPLPAYYQAKLDERRSYKNDEKNSTQLPLTKENLMRMHQQSPSPVSRLVHYYDSLTHAVSERTSNSHVQPRSYKHRPSSVDTVVESPRILTFPYHNDSFFLPTAEKVHCPRYTATHSPALSLVDVHSYSSSGFTSTASGRTNTLDHSRPTSAYSGRPLSNKSKGVVSKKTRFLKRTPATNSLRDTPSVEVCHITNTHKRTGSNPLSRVFRLFQKKTCTKPKDTIENSIWYSPSSSNSSHHPLSYLPLTMATA
ncbi:hypothetical protein BDF14DRAFT_1809959 [Spinellus fusiger]|nr:hypothetical protein BDF14DRAFT_1809959 [Spinellus fusiger]